MKNFIVLMLMALMILPLVSATENLASLPPIKQGACMPLVQYCSNCTYVNITSMSFPNGTVISLNYLTEKFGADTYVNNSFCDTNQLGGYTYGTMGDINGVITSQPVSREVTTTGYMQTTSQGMGSIAFLILMMGLTCLFGWIGFKLAESKNLWVLGVFFMFLAIIMIVYDVWLGYEYHKNLTGASDSAIPELIFYIFLFITVCGLLVSLGLLFLRYKEVFRYFKKELRRKEDDERDEFEFLDKYER